MLQTIQKCQDRFTTTDQKIATYVLENYPHRGIDTLQNLAQNSGVSLPSVTRFVNKLGFSRYSDFYQSLLKELKNTNISPIDLYDSLQHSMGQECLINGEILYNFALQSNSVITRMSSLISETQFQKICDKIADPKRKVYLIGGRFSDSLMHILYMELLQIRDGIYHIPTDTNTWSEYILRMKKNDVCIIIDYRRYQQSLAKLAKMIKTHKKSYIITITNGQDADICTYASETLITPIDTKTPWDSYGGALTLCHAIAYCVGSRDWDKTKHRITQWDRYKIS